MKPLPSGPASKRPDLLVGEDLPPPPRQKRSLAKRERLKSAGLVLFAEAGYEGSSIEAIASQANLAVGGFYLHFRSKRQLLLVLMDELLDELDRLDVRPKPARDIKEGIRALLTQAFTADVRYLGAYRAWQEAMLADPELAKKQRQIQDWTSGRVAALFRALHQLPGARKKIDIPGLARAMDSFFWSLLAQASQMPGAELKQSIDAATHLMYHAVFIDP